MEEHDDIDMSKIFDIDDILDGKTYYTALSDEENNLLNKYFEARKEEIEAYYGDYQDEYGDLVTDEYHVCNIVDDVRTIMQLKYLLARELRKNVANHPGVFYKDDHYAVCELGEWLIPDEDMNELEIEVESSLDEYTRPKHAVGYLKDSEKTANEYTYVLKSDLRRLIEEVTFLNYILRKYCKSKGENNND